MNFVGRWRWDGDGMSVRIILNIQARLCKRNSRNFVSSSVCVTVCVPAFILSGYVELCCPRICVWRKQMHF